LVGVSLDGALLSMRAGERVYPAASKSQKTNAPMQA
jgi:hypothetical protein